MITKEQRERLEAMCDPAQNMWDLSPNDAPVIAAALADLDAQRGQLDAIEDAIIGHDDEDMKHPKCTVAELVKRVLVERDAQREEIAALGRTLADLNDGCVALEAERHAQREEYDDMVRAFCRAAGVERDDHGQAVERVTKMRDTIDSQREEIAAHVAQCNMVGAQRDALEAEVAALHGIASEIHELAVEGWDYAPTYFTEKWHGKDRAHTLKQALDALRKEGK